MAITAAEHGGVIKVTGTTATADDIVDRQVDIQAIVWYGATTDGHKLSITDADGNQIWKAQMNTSNLGENISITFPKGVHSEDGIYCDDMDSGEVYIYLQ
jgi:hypothetical protein